MNASDVLDLLVTDYPHMLAIKTFTTGSPAIAEFKINETNHFLSLTYTASELEKSSEYRSIEDIDKALSKIGDTYNLVFVDPWHTYDDSLRGLEIALKFVRPDGFIVVHDCLAHEASMSPEYVRGAWSGVTAIVFRDFVSNLNRNWCVLDSNHGIGIIGPELEKYVKPDSPDDERWASSTLDEKIVIFREDPLSLMRAIAPSQMNAALSNLKSGLDIKELSARYSQSPDSFKPEVGNVEFKQLLDELNSIKNSRIWRLTTSYRTMRNRFKGLPRS